MIAEEQKKNMKNFLRDSLQRQMDQNKAVSETSKANEMDADRQCLAQMNETQFIENKAFDRKNETMK